MAWVYSDPQLPVLSLHTLTSTMPLRMRTKHTQFDAYGNFMGVEVDGYWTYGCILARVAVFLVLYLSK